MAKMQNGAIFGKAFKWSHVYKFSLFVHVILFLAGCKGGVLFKPPTFLKNFASVIRLLSMTRL